LLDKVVPAWGSINHNPAFSWLSPIFSPDSRTQVTPPSML
jgi:hypothetical protein